MNTGSLKAKEYKMLSSRSMEMKNLKHLMDVFGYLAQASEAPHSFLYCSAFQMVWHHGSLVHCDDCSVCDRNMNTHILCTP